MTERVRPRFGRRILPVAQPKKGTERIITSPEMLLTITERILEIAKTDRGTQKKEAV